MEANSSRSPASGAPQQHTGLSSTGDAASNRAGICSLPVELLETIISHLLFPDCARALLALRRTCRDLRQASTQASLWRRVVEAAHTSGVSLPSLPRECHVSGSAGAEELEWCALHGLHNTPHPQRSPWNYSLRAHADRITCLKLVVAPSRRARKRRKFESHSTVPGGSEGASEIRYKYCRQAWLITGAIDGWVRVWDVGRMMEEQQGRAGFRGTEQDADSEGASVDRVTTNSLSDRMRSLGMTARVTGSTTPVGSKPPIAGGDALPLLTPRRRTERSASGHSAARGRPAGREYLVCSICTAADVTALDAELHSSPRDDSGAPQRTKLRIACGSYYSDAAVTLYEVELPDDEAAAGSEECTNRARDAVQLSTLSPSAWCGVQCLVLKGSLVAVGTYTGLVHIWETGVDCSPSTSGQSSSSKTRGWKCVIERPERKSVAILRLELGGSQDCKTLSLLLVTRTGELEWWTLPMGDVAQVAQNHEPFATRFATPTYRDETATGGALESFAPVREGPHQTTPQEANTTSEMQQAAHLHPHMLYKMSLGDGLTPMLGLAFSEPYDDVAGRLPPGIGSGRNARRPLSLLLGDMGGISHWRFPKQDREAASMDALSDLPYAPEPEQVSRSEVTNERPIGLALGQSGNKAIFHSSLGGVPPLCCVRVYDCSEPGMQRICPFEGLAKVDQGPLVPAHMTGLSADSPLRVLPSAAGSAPLPSPHLAPAQLDSEAMADDTHTTAGPTSSTNLSAALAGLRGRQRPAVGGSTMRMFDAPSGEDASSSSTTSVNSSGTAAAESATTTSSSNTPSQHHGIKRADILTEAAFADSLGLTVFATARGYLHITDWCTSAVM